MLTAVFGVNDEVYGQIDLLQKNQVINSQNHLRLNTMVDLYHNEVEHRFMELLSSMQQAHDVIDELNSTIYQHTLINHLMASYAIGMGYI